MDSYERLRRMNELSKELRQRGFAESSVEAIRQAQKVYGADENDPITSVQEMDPKETDTFTEKNTKMEFDQTAHVLRAQEKFKEQLNQRIDALASDVTSAVGKVNEIIKKINELEAGLQQVRNVRSAPAPQPVKAPERPVEKPHEPKKEPDQRTGGYGEGDVSIEKVFYMGNK